MRHRLILGGPKAPWPLSFACALAALAPAACAYVDPNWRDSGGRDGGSADGRGEATPRDTLPGDRGSRDAGGDGASDGSPPGDQPGEGGGRDGGDGGRVRSCESEIRFRPDRPVGQAFVAGEWNGFSATAMPLTDPDGDGTFAASVRLDPGVHAYKLVVDGEWRLDPGNDYRKYVGGIENSGLRVGDCRDPLLVVERTETTRPAGTTGGGRFVARLRYLEGSGGGGPAALSASLGHHGTQRVLSGTEARFDTTTGSVELDLAGLEDGKYTVTLRAQSEGGRSSAPLRLPFWVEAERFDWRDALIYMVVTDRFRNGDPGNDPLPVAGVVRAADFQGGDLEGVRQAIADGTLDRLGVRALWLTPFNTNPQGSFLASDRSHQVTGYHGYWPTRAREVDPRLGGESALGAMVAEAHRHGIRVLADFVINHVHVEHEYFAAHPGWFRTGCVCGTTGCDWTEHRLDCVFSDYMPDVNWTVAEASEQFIADALHWLTEHDLDGFRVDAVKHVEDLAIYNLAMRVHEELHTAGAHYFLLGETAMGWCDASPDDPCNQQQYQTISRYIGPNALSGQFDFVLYHAVPYRVFAYDERGMIHADYWLQASLSHFPQGAVMTPYIASHDTERFVSLATYRGQDTAHDRNIPHNKWDHLPASPDSPEPYGRHRTALSWLLTLPGAPLLYYGDEYGEYGGSDPDNRHLWRPESALSMEEAATLAQVRLLGQARRGRPALRRGGYLSLGATETFLAFARQATGDVADVAVVALSRNSEREVQVVKLPPGLGLSEGQELADLLGGAAVRVESGAITVRLPPRGAAIYAPQAP